MIRKTAVIMCLLFALAAVVIGLAGLGTERVLWKRPLDGRPFETRHVVLSHGFLRIQWVAKKTYPMSSSFQGTGRDVNLNLGLASFTSSSFFMSSVAVTVYRLTEVALHFSAVALLFCLYPLAVLMRGPLRRLRRRRKGLCIRCGYNLTGNVSGACPECGENI